VKNSYFIIEGSLYKNFQGFKKLSLRIIGTLTVSN